MVTAQQVFNAPGEGADIFLHQIEGVLRQLARSLQGSNIVLRGTAKENIQVKTGKPMHMDMNRRCATHLSSPVSHSQLFTLAPSPMVTNGVSYINTGGASRKIRNRSS